MKSGNWLGTETPTSHSTKSSSHRFSSHLAETSERHISSSESRPKNLHSLHTALDGQTRPTPPDSPPVPPRNQQRKTDTSRSFVTFANWPTNGVYITRLFFQLLLRSLSLSCLFFSRKTSFTTEILASFSYGRPTTFFAQSNPFLWPQNPSSTL